MSMRQWREDLIVERIRDLNDAKMKAFTVASIYYGTPQPVVDLIGNAIRCLEQGDLDTADQLCEQAEQEIVVHARHLDGGVVE